jgi:hypothetical protein
LQAVVSTRVGIENNINICVNLTNINLEPKMLQKKEPYNK